MVGSEGKLGSGGERVAPSFVVLTQNWRRMEDDQNPQSEAICMYECIIIIIIILFYAIYVRLCSIMYVFHDQR